MKTRVLMTAIAATTVAMFMTGCGREGSDSTGTEPREKQGAAQADNAKDSKAQVELSGATCAGHGAPKELCFICDASLRDKGRLWCREHARYEDRCWLCHPELEDKDRLWCKEHSLYEDECFLCHPELAEGENEQASHESHGLFCTEHGVPEAECGICHPELTEGLATGQGIKVRLPAAESAGLVGVRTARPQNGGVSESVECLAEIGFNENKLAQIVAPVGGIVQSVVADLGSLVEEGQPVAKLWSASIAEAVAKAVLTHQTLDREQRLRAERVTSERDLQEAEAEHRAACQQLRTFGFTEDQIEELGHKPQESVLLEVRAPLAGEIVKRNAVRGELVEAGRSLFVVVDRSVMWADLSIPETALGHMRVGQPVELAVDALPGKTFVGKLTWIGPAVDERTRMARARAEVPNPNGELRDRMFAQARIRTQGHDGALLVPSSAIHRVGGNPFLFVKLADDLFEARSVKLGARSDERQQVAGGLFPTDEVVVEQGFAIKSQLLISRLGAGCAHE